MTLETDLANLSIVISWFVGIVTDVMGLFMQMPLVIFTGGVVVAMGFALVRRFFRAKK